ncbi:DoxX family protein [Streptomyces jeddahensis]|uniref:Putative oxidoreductase MhqP n=1 Tax=Streptomyces jeddahensis TaxID=1716141 RepID=A0A177HP90_9ACTN|nr:DoxX family protein [Streptomyces jeddahensis]OAH12735.1 putative oxidoreductase MhqP [Streptomyces jeddahensis]
MKVTAPRLRTASRPDAAASPPLTTSAADVGMLLLRLAVGLLLAGHGAQKLFGIFGGPGLSASGKGFAELGYHPGEFFAGLAGASELLGGLGLAVGLLTPLAAAAVVGVMINAMATTSSNGLWADKGGMEYPLVLASAAIAVAAVGPGLLSLDRPFRWRHGGWLPAGVAVGLGAVGAVVVLAFT